MSAPAPALAGHRFGLGEAHLGAVGDDAIGWLRKRAAGSAALPLLPLLRRGLGQRDRGMAKACLRDGTPFGVCLIREGREVGVPALPEETGCTARLVEWDMPQLGLLQVVARGERRFRILGRRVQADGLALAEIELLPEARDAPIDAQGDLCARVLRRIVEAAPPGLGQYPFLRQFGRGE